MLWRRQMDPQTQCGVLLLGLGSKALSSAGRFFTAYQASPHNSFPPLHQKHVSGIDSLTF